MADTKRPGAHHSDRAGEFVLTGTVPHTIETLELQRYANPPCRIVSWRVSRWLDVEAVEVANGR